MTARSSPAASGAAAAAGARADGFAGLFADAAAGEGVLLLLLLAAFGWGAVHALSPGHGKAMVAAYLVGTRGTPRQAVALGATVTVTHTAGVVLLGVVALTLSQYVLPEDLYPWLNLVAGLLVLGVGAAVLRGRLARQAPAHATTTTTTTRRPSKLSARGLVAMGASAGLIPCPSALVVLLGAVAQHQIALGLAADRRVQRGARRDADRARAGGGVDDARGRPAAGARTRARGAPDAVGDRDRRGRVPAHDAGAATGCVIV